jgi:hypothetical protein
MVEMIELKRRLELFFKHKINIHIDTHDGKFYNGLILELGSDFLLLHERILGRTFVLFSQVKILEAYKEKEERGE